MIFRDGCVRVKELWLCFVGYRRWGRWGKEGWRRFDGMGWDVSSAGEERRGEGRKRWRW